MQRLPVPGFQRAALAQAAVLSAAACSGLSAPRAGDEIARAVGLEQAIELRVEGGAIDAEPRTTDRLSLAEAVRLAVERDASVQSALARVQAAFASAEQARRLPNPVLSLVLRWPEGGGPAEIEAGIAAELLALFKRPRQIDAAGRRLRASAADAVATSLDAVAGTRTSYAEAQALDELRLLLLERRALAERMVELSKVRLEFGEAARVDVTTLEAQRAELDVEIADLELARREARLELARRIGEPSSDAEWLLDPWEALPDSTPDEQVWVSQALQRRPELQAMVLELAALGDEAAIASLSVWDGSTLGVEAERTDGWSIGPQASLPLPLDLGGPRKAKAQAEIVAARHELTDRSRRVVEEVRRALASYRAAVANLHRVRDELVPLQRQRREDVEAVYLAGHTDLTPLLLAEQDLQATQSKLVELEKRAAASLIELERAVGGPLVAREVLEP